MCGNCGCSNLGARELCKECSCRSEGMVTVEQPANLQKRKHNDLRDMSTWKCDTCSHRNFASASECFKCKSSQEVQLKRKKENPNNWTCGACSNSNWPHRTVCNRCKAPKPGYELQMRNGSNSEWTCLNCDNINRAFRTECNKCKMNKADAVNPRTGQLRTNQDWLCMSCGNSNYPYRIACNKCKLPKHQAMTATRSFDSDKAENWLCFNCDNVNLPFRTECNKCKIDKKEGVNPETAFKRTNLDWKCTVCENVNFYYRVFCNKCQLPKSEIGEEVAGGRGGDARSNSFPSFSDNTSSSGAVALPEELSGVPTEPIEAAAAAMYKEQVRAVGSSNVNYTIQHEIVNDRNNNWTCFNCDNLNYPLRTQCNKCRMSKAEAVAPETRAGRMATGDGHWQCSACGNGNYHFRLECNKCKAERPPRTVRSNPYAYDSGYGQGYPVQQYNNSYTQQSHQSTPTSSWICTSCQNVNWPKRTKCNKCGLEKSAANPNWVCAHCSHINYSFSTDCNSCKAPKDS